MTNSHSEEKGGSAKTLLYGVIIALGAALFIVYAATLFYTRSGSEHPIFVSLSRVFQVPALAVNGEKILYSEFLSDKKALELFYSKDENGLFGELSAKDIERQVTSRLIANKLIAQAAAELNVEVSPEDLTAAKETVVSGFESEQEARDEILSRYGWPLETFVERVVGPLTLEQKLQAAYAQNPPAAEEGKGSEQVRASHILFRTEEGSDEAVVRAAAEQVLGRALAGEDFAALAAEFGQDGTAEAGGDLGWFARGVMVPEFEAAAFSLESGVISPELIKTDFGFHIIKTADKKFTQTFGDYMNTRLLAARIGMYGGLENPFAELLAEPAETDDDEAQADPSEEAESAEPASESGE